MSCALLFGVGSDRLVSYRDANALERRQSCPCSGGCNGGAVCCSLRCGCGAASDTTCI
ncbi:hypothetical protein BD626DRAFT_474464 [Schizophyllum amplum]|uniref:Uncharacterized protein n=1 Tax=Schizophyllum amplum TaxID=97359 RepID=A0A550CXM3_9AGAR|nr:hypothetical protein BD626DRAFT_474464 [Auriculariopsis ampla]